MEEQAIKHCRQVLKKNNLHPLKKLGRGGFSVVFLVEKIELKQTQNQLYSVKCINKRQFLKRPSLQKYIDQEINTWRDLAHPNIVKLIRSFEDQGWIFMIMEYCDQGSLQLAQHNKEGKIFPLCEAVRILKETIDGLEYMHSKNLIHRDIKAENVLLSSNGQKGSQPTTKICDLGFCREDDDAVNTFCGTTNYMAPEIFEKKTYDLKVDVWALGVLLFLMLFGEFPFRGLNVFHEIGTRCEKGFNLKSLKLRTNPSLSKSDLQTLGQLFAEIFRLDPSKRIGLSDLQKYKWFASEKSSRNTTIESDSSEDENSLESEKAAFLKQIVGEVKQAKFLNSLEEASFRYYINKMQAVFLEPKIKEDKVIRKNYEEILVQNEELGSLLTVNLKKNPIPQFADVFNPKCKSFAEFKQAYRMVVGHTFSKAHRSISEDLGLRSRLKLKLFCCHVINRVFERENRNDIFVHYFGWLKREKKTSRFDFRSFQKWVEAENADRLVQTVQLMNDKFYRRST